jgi:hypothetical protein
VEAHLSCLQAVWEKRLPAFMAAERLVGVIIAFIRSAMNTRQNAALFQKKALNQGRHALAKMLLIFPR